MKRSSIQFLFLFLASCGSLCASSHQGVLWAEALYLAPTYGGVAWAMGHTGDLPQAVGRESSGAFNTKAICHDYQWGVRVGTGHVWDCLLVDLSADYIHFRDGARSQGELTSSLALQTAYALIADNANLDPALPILGVGKAILQTTAWNINGRIGCRWDLCQGIALSTFGGVGYLSLNEQLDVNIRGTALSFLAPAIATEIEQQRILLFNGAGPLATLRCDVCLSHCFSFEVQTGLAFLFGRRDSDTRANFSAFFDGAAPLDSQGNQHFGGDKCFAAIPAYDLRLTLAGHCTCCCLDIAGFIGYELAYYWSAFDQNLGSISLNPGLIAQPNLRDVGFAGPVIGGSIAF